MIYREITPWIEKISAEYPVISIMGPRQSGKTTLAKTAFPNHAYINLEDPDIRRMALADGAAFIAKNPAPLIIDEVQRVPELLSRIQVKVDESPLKAAYVLTGSHQPLLRQSLSQSLAGRVALTTLLPLTISEIASATNLPDRENLILSGFMPRIWGENASPGPLYSNYLATYVERDVNAIISLKDRRRFETFLRLLAGRTGQLVNCEALSAQIGVSAVTVKSWISILEACYVIFTLPCYYRNFGKRFVKTPKIYFTDVGLLCHLLGIREPFQVDRDPLFGGIFENLAILEILKNRLNRGLEPDMYFIRDYKGFEIDLVVENGRRLDLYEIKSSSSFHAGFADNLNAFAAIADAPIAKTVIYSGTDCSVQDVRYVNYQNISNLLMNV